MSSSSLPQYLQYPFSQQKAFIRHCRYIRSFVLEGYRKSSSLEVHKIMYRWDGMVRRVNCSGVFRSVPKNVAVQDDQN